MASALLTFCFSINIRKGKDADKVVSNKICQCDRNDSWRDVMVDLLDEVDRKHFKTDKVAVSVSSNNTAEQFHPDVDESAAVVYDFDQTLKYVSFVVEHDSCSETQVESPTSNAFDKLMTATTGTKPPRQKSADGARFTAKDRLYNDICRDLLSAGVAFPTSMPDDTVGKHVEAITAALWYIDGCKEKLNERAKHVPNGTPLPPRFSDNFNNYNEWKLKNKRHLDLMCLA